MAWVHIAEDAWLDGVNGEALRLEILVISAAARFLILTVRFPLILVHQLIAQNASAQLFGRNLYNPIEWLDSSTVVQGHWSGGFRCSDAGLVRL